MRVRRAVASALVLCVLVPFAAAPAAHASARLDKCSVSVNSHHPKRYSNVTAKSRAVDSSGRPIKGAKVVFAWYFKSGRVSETKLTNRLGFAYSTRSTGGAPSSYRVAVRAMGSSGGVTKSVATWFLPGAAPDSDVQKVSIGIGSSGYVPSTLGVMSGRRVSLLVARGTGCAAGFRIPQLGVSADNSRGPVTVALPALKPGTYRFTCGMGMLTGRIVAK